MLTISERVILNELLPAEGNILTLRVANDIRNAIAITDAEGEAIKLVQEGDRIRWDGAMAAQADADIEITTAGKGLIVEQLKKLNEQQKLTANHITLYEKFVEAAA